MNFKLFRLVALAGCALAATNYIAAQTPATLAPASAAESKNINDWLMRMHEASRNRSYVGTFVVSSGGVMSSAKIWHVCDGEQQIERVETLTGAARSIFRHNDQVVTFLPEHKVVRTEKRESLGLFPELLKSTDSHIADFYKARQEGRERVAGLEADVIALIPKDKLRFGYRVWAEQKKGLVVKLQTLDTDGKVLEQAAFSELQFDAPVKLDKLAQMMNKVEGYRVEKPELVKTTANAEGWVLKTPVAGFQPMSCYKRPDTAQSQGEPMQWIFSDGLASVSLFVEPFDSQRHTKESKLSMGATQSLTRRMDAFWLTAMGEVPMSTLRLFADGLERKK
ncbi:MucB/RseB C-terminal domain-containing protein [Polaromonas sp. SM01]|uniref:MucB/RseB C-terminal domain-containing protein n=1 Tax=Polaromonas sp. SM01 TaxID=3085630 RepID=UPI002981B017|nr:MucB/RseB C-terminal domain-containing protein [Polaromonas sp. SM01]MDW5443696.1 MucB/RseB C-terminal domain-containing protein [Polaromonas sp. SM01]